MTTTVAVISEAAHEMAALPIVWLGWLHFRGREPGIAWWWLAGAFFVSWLADTAAHFANPWLGSQVYPVSQAALIGAVFLARRDVTLLIVTLAVVGLVDVFWFGVGDFDIFLRTVAWLSIVGIVYPLWPLGRLRGSLLVSFGIGWLCWLGYAIDPGWTTWSAYQLTRLAGIVLFCVAATSPLPHLKLYRK